MFFLHHALNRTSLSPLPSLQAHLEEIFGEYGVVTEVELDRTRPMDRAILTFETHEQAHTAFERMNRGQIDGKVVGVTFPVEAAVRNGAPPERRRYSRSPPPRRRCLCQIPLFTPLRPRLLWWFSNSLHSVGSILFLFCCVECVDVCGALAYSLSLSLSGLFCCGPQSLLLAVVGTVALLDPHTAVALLLLQGAVSPPAQDLDVVVATPPRLGLCLTCPGQEALLM